VSQDTALLFGAHRTLVGVLTEASRRNDTAVILLNAGLIHHVGPHRLHVRLARALATAGVSCLRFDFSGIGDSPARPDNLPILKMVEREPLEAMDTLEGRGFRRFVLMGICSGAYSAFKVAGQDSRVVGAVLINPQNLNDDGGSEAATWTRRYWTRSIFRRRAWLNLLTGRVNYRRLFRTMSSQIVGDTKARRFQPQDLQRELDKLVSVNRTRMLFVASEDDVSIEYLALLLGHHPLRDAANGAVGTVTIPDADHLFTVLKDQQKLIEAIVGWTMRVADH
jgi:Alpha/beta hydrolase family